MDSLAHQTALRQRIPLVLIPPPLHRARLPVATASMSPRAATQLGWAGPACLTWQAWCPMAELSQATSTTKCDSSA